MANILRSTPAGVHRGAREKSLFLRSGLELRGQILKHKHANPKPLLARFTNARITPSTRLGAFLLLFPKFRLAHQLMVQGLGFKYSSLSPKKAHIPHSQMPRCAITRQ